MRIFIGLNEVAGYYKNLKKGFEKIGYSADFFCLTPHPFKYSNKENYKSYSLINILQNINKKKGKVGNWSFKGIILLLISLLFRTLLFLIAIFKYDVFIFGFKSTFFRLLDIPILKFCGKKVIFVFHGSDARPPYLNGVYCADLRKYSKQKIIKLSNKIKRDMKFIEKYADIVINHPPMALFNEKSFIQWLYIGIPFTCEVNFEIIEPIKKDKNKIRILHAPSKRLAKGTNEIKRCIESLKKRGYSIELIEISGLPNSNVIKELKKCDFVIDQVYSDTPLAGFATEAAFFGKPAVVGSYYCEQIKKDIEMDFIPPSLFCFPSELEKNIEILINEEKFRLELGKKAKKFVREKWTPSEVAKKYIKLINNEFPEKWLFNPYNAQYHFGACVSKERIKFVILDILSSTSKKALCLSDKPNLERKIINIT